MAIRVSYQALMLVMSLFALIGCTEYDHATPDTSANLAGYTRHFNAQPSADVRGVYYYADEFGANAIYQIRFEADASTVQRLVVSMGLSTSVSSPNQSVARDDLPWWPSDRTSSLSPYVKQHSGGSRWQLLWHDPEAREVFYLEFSE